MQKKTFLSYIKIEYILFILAFLSIISTFYFKFKESSNFQNILDQLECTKVNSEEIINWETSKKDKYFSELEHQAVPFTDYNKDVYNALEQYISYFKKTDNTIQQIPGDELSDSYITLYKLLYKQQQQLGFGFIWTLLVPIFISLVSFFSISEKEKIKKNELKLISIINENQLKLSRELHDGIAQDLAALRISIQNKDNEKTTYFADQAFNEIRFLLENTHLEINQDFIPNIKDILSNFERHFGIHTELYLASNNVKSLPTTYQFELIRILNEALSNVARHAQAKNVVIRITDTIKGFHFIITDDGIGKDSFNTNDEYTKHFGIENIKSRVSEMNGTISFDFEGGTTIAIALENFIS